MHKSVYNENIRLKNKNMKAFMKIGFFLLLIIGVFAVSTDGCEIAFVGHANAESFPSFEDGLKDAEFGKETSPTVSGVIVKVMKFILSFVAALAVVYLIVAGIIYITAGGDEKRIEMAKTMIIQAIYGLIIVLLAWVIVNIVSKVVGM